MIIENFNSLILFALIPIIATVVLYSIDLDIGNKIRYRNKQIIIGLIFGAIAVINTDYGPNISGYVMNVRDAAPVCAALVFGAPAGIIAGLIGGIERWIAVYWGIGTYTRVACSIATSLAGIFAALLKKVVFDNHIPKPVYAFACGLVTEVFHMLMVFVTHFDDTVRAFSVVQACTVPMVLTNTLSPGIAVTLVYLIRNKFKTKKADTKVSISQVFQRRILITVVIAFLITNGFTFMLQEGLASSSINEILTLNVDDVKGDIISASDESLLNTSITISEKINKIKNLTLEDIEAMADAYSVNEINIVNDNGIITLTTNPNYVGFDMNSSEQSREFIDVLATGEHYYIQDLEKIGYDNTTYMKYVGVRLKGSGFVQVGYNSEKFYSDLSKSVKSLATYRHVGESGHVIIGESSTGKVVSDHLQSEGLQLEDLGIDHTRKLNEDSVHVGEINGIKSFYKVAYIEGYTVVAYEPYDEALFSEYISIYITTFLQIIIYAVIFVLVFLAVNTTVVNNVATVNSKLLAITNGDLDTIVDVRSNEEFNLLSNGINSTVGKLKDLIKLTEDKMKAELEYAAEIQRSALPSNFPAFPDRKDIDIYAMMTPAKEVGGDFYDFYFIDANKLAILIADVSGKGIPASLFMMRAKTIIKSYAEFGIAVNDVFTNVNFNLCDGNEAGLFVTAWMGILDLETGHMTFANAGHNPPLIRKPNGDFEYLRTKPGFVLGGMEGISYKMNEIDIEPGSEIFIYTDGLTEAQNIKQELYGEDRLLASINSYEFVTSEDICKNIKRDVDGFVGEADQFDDLTMLHLKFLKKTFD